MSRRKNAVADPSAAANPARICNCSTLRVASGSRTSPSLSIFLAAVHAAVAAFSRGLSGQAACAFASAPIDVYAPISLYDWVAVVATGTS